MSEEIRVARYERNTGEVGAPAVGEWLDPPGDGEWLGPGARIGTLRVLNRSSALVLPEDASGRVEREGGDSRVLAVEYAETLFRLAPLEGAETGSASRRRRRGASQEGLPAGTHAVLAPSDGVFYGRPAPEEPSFVEVGSRIHHGQPVGLVEVMKTFNQIVYGGPSLPEQAEVVELRCTDGAEIAAGAVLMVVRAI